MSMRDELVVSARDAEALAAMLGRHRRENPFEADASDALAELLMTARLVPTERLPGDRIAMHSAVTLHEEPTGRHYIVTLVYPEAANARGCRVSILSAIGLALIGRARGALVEAELSGRHSAVRIIDTSQHYTLPEHASGRSL